MNFYIKQLDNNQEVSRIKKLADDFIVGDDFVLAYDLSKELTSVIESDKNFRLQNNDLFNEYAKIIIKLRWVGLSIMQEEKVIEMFRNNYTKIFNIPEFDVWERLKRVLIAIPFLPDRDMFKLQIRDALLNNKEKLTNQEILTGKEIRQPTVGNWLADYNFEAGNAIGDKLKKSQYLVNGINIKKMNQAEKDKVKTLISLFEKLKLSSITLEGVEEEIPIDEEYGHGLIVGGVPQFSKENKKEKELFDIASLVIAKRDNKAVNSLQKDLKNYSTDILSKKAIEEEIDEKKKIEDFKIMANKFSMGSLERKAIDEEIARLNKE